MSRIFYLPTFLKQIRALRGKEANACEKALIAFQNFIQIGTKPEGLGFKKLSSDQFEVRVDLKKRIMMKKIDDDYYLALYGDHAAIERFLKR